MVLNRGDVGNDYRLSLVSRSVNTANCSFRTDILKREKLLKLKYLAIFISFNLYSLAVLNRGDAGNRTRVQTSGQKAFYILSFYLIFDN